MGCTQKSPSIGFVYIKYFPYFCKLKNLLMRFYRLFDTEIPRLMLSGYNETELEEIRECILAVGLNRIGDTKLNKLKNLDTIVLASYFDIEIQESDVEFPELEDPKHLIKNK